MDTRVQTNSQAAPPPSFTPAPRGLLQRKCACGGAPGLIGECAECAGKKVSMQRRTSDQTVPNGVPPIVHDVLRSPGQPLDAHTRAFMEPRFGHNFGQVRVHTDSKAVEASQAVSALAFTVGDEVVFGAGQYRPGTTEGANLLVHELTHVVQQRLGAQGSVHGMPDRIGSVDSPEEQQADAVATSITAGIGRTSSAPTVPTLQRRVAPYIKKVTVHLTPPQSADLEWKGTPPADAPGSDHFTVSTGKGYGDPGDPPGTCTRDCCGDPTTQCASPWSKPSKVGACCTYVGDTFWTGTPVQKHNDWKWWTPIQPFYSKRGIALHQHGEVTGQPIGHGCVRMGEPNAKRIYDYSNRKRTNVTIEGDASPVACESHRRCGADAEGLKQGQRMDSVGTGERFAVLAVPGLEGEMT